MGTVQYGTGAGACGGQALPLPHGHRRPTRGTTSTASCWTTPSPGEGHHHRRVRDLGIATEKANHTMAGFAEPGQQPPTARQSGPAPGYHGRAEGPLPGRASNGSGAAQRQSGPTRGSHASATWIPRKFCRSVYVCIHGTGTRPFSENHPFAAD